MVLRNTQITYTKTKCTDRLKKHIIEIKIVCESFKIF